MKFQAIFVSIFLIGVVFGQNITFDKPAKLVYPSEIPNIFQSSVPLRDLQVYPLAREAILSVALKLQALEGRDGKPRNFLVSPLAVAGALGQLMLGARGNLRRQLAVLLTLQSLPKNRNPGDPASTERKQVENRFGEDTRSGQNESASHPTTRISANNIWGYQPQDRNTLPSSNTRDDGIPGLELHYQLGGLIQALSMPIPKDGAVHPITNSSYLHTSSAFFMDHNLVLNEQFARAIRDYYGSSLIPLDFRGDPLKAQHYINEWGSNATGGLIDKFLKYPPKPNTAVIQGVTVHFRGAWETPFLPAATITGTFRTSENTTSSVKFMRGTLEGAPYAEDEKLGLRIVVLPYSNFDCGMYVVLPTENHPLKFDIGQLMANLKPKEIADLVAMTKKRTVNVIFPKLSLTSSLSMGAALRKHAEYLSKKKVEEDIESKNGAPISPSNFAGQPQVTIGTRLDINLDKMVVNDTQQASRNASGTEAAGIDKSSRSIRRSRVLEPEVPDTTTEGMILDNAASNSMFRVSDIVQQIALEINEAGTEAAAIAGSTINYSGGVKNFRVNRPFLFFLRQEETNALLFWGTIVDPSA